jgi:Trk K+ transport system NAD-binding subunit
MAMEKEERLVVVGYGDVGKSIVDELKRARVKFVVVDRNEDALLDKGFDYVVGDGSNEDILRRAGVASASTIIIALNIDTDAIFATLVARTLNPAAIILTRANAPIKSTGRVPIMWHRSPSWSGRWLRNSQSLSTKRMS